MSGDGLDEVMEGILIAYGIPVAGSWIGDRASLAKVLATAARAYRIDVRYEIISDLNEAQLSGSACAVCGRPVSRCGDMLTLQAEGRTLWVCADRRACEHARTTHPETKGGRDGQGGL